MEYLNLKKQYLSIKPEIDEAVKRVVENCSFIGGEEVSSLEKEIASFSGVEFGIGVNSGTDALFLALKVLGIERGDEVITTPFTFMATAEAISNVGAKPVFVDIHPDTFNLDASKIEAKINEKTKAIMVVHLFGQVADMEDITRIAKENNLSVIEDAAQAIGAEYENKKAGSFGDLGCFSFFPSKNLGGFGDGGMIVTKDNNLDSNLRILKNHGSSRKEKYLNLVLGINSRLDAIQAAVLRVKLRHLNNWSKKRAENAEIYNQELKGVGDIITPITPENRNHIYNQYTIRTSKRDELKNYLKERNIPSMVYYPLPLHLQPAFSYLGHDKGDYPEAEKASQEVLSLPIYPELTREEIAEVIKAIKNFYGM